MCLILNIKDLMCLVLNIKEKCHIKELMCLVLNIITRVVAAILNFSELHIATQFRPRLT